MKKILLFLLISLVICQNLRKLSITDTYNELLEKHNSIRAKHKSPALTYSEAIAKIAQATSERYLELGKIEQKNEYYNENYLVKIIMFVEDSYAFHQILTLLWVIDIIERKLFLIMQKVKQNKIIVCM